MIMTTSQFIHEKLRGLGATDYNSYISACEGGQFQDCSPLDGTCIEQQVALSYACNDAFTSDPGSPHNTTNPSSSVPVISISEALAMYPSAVSAVVGGSNQPDTPITSSYFAPTQTASNSGGSVPPSSVVPTTVVPPVSTMAAINTTNSNTSVDTQVPVSSSCGLSFSWDTSCIGGVIGDVTLMGLVGIGILFMMKGGKL